MKNCVAFDRCLMRGHLKKEIQLSMCGRGRVYNTLPGIKALCPALRTFFTDHHNRDLKKEQNVRLITSLGNQLQVKD